MSDSSLEAGQGPVQGQGQGQGQGAGPQRGAGAYPPIRVWLPQYRWRQDLVHDALAGVTVGVMAVPQSLSYAFIAGLPPQYGLYSDLQVCYPVFGTSKFLVVGPVAVMSLMSRAAMEKVGVEEGSAEWVDMVCLLSVLVALLQFAAGALGLGSRMASFLPETAVAGFSSAAAIIIGSTQLPALLGLPKCVSSAGQSCDCLATSWYALTSLHRARLPSVVCGALSFAALAAFKSLQRHGDDKSASAQAHERGAASVVASLAPKLGALFVVVASTCVFYATSDEGEGEGEGPLGAVDLVGFIPTGLPAPRWLPTAPRSAAMLASLAMSAVPMALVGFAEASAIAKTSARLRGGEAEVRTLSDNREVLALAFCNAFTSVVGGFPVSGSFSRTAINAASGARSAVSTAVAALAVVVVLLCCTSHLAYLPKPAVSAIVLSAVARLVDVGEFRRLLRLSQGPARDLGVWVFAAVFVASLVFGVETGLFCGVLAHYAAGLL